MNQDSSRRQVCRKCGTIDETFLGVVPLKCAAAEMYGWECGRELIVEDEDETQKAGGQPDGDDA